MEVVDELMTPGCPNCALKHLSAAVSLCVDFPTVMIPDSNVPPVDDCVKEALVCTARAYINFMEAIEGYESHFEFAVGLLVRAEEFAILGGDVSLAYNLRESRVKLMVDKKNPRALEHIRYVSLPAMAIAHVLEARRELPAGKDHISWDYTSTVSSLQSSIKWIKEQYFDVPAEGDEEEKGGEEDMKKVAKKAEKVVAKPAKKDAKKCVGKCKK